MLCPGRFILVESVPATIQRILKDRGRKLNIYSCNKSFKKINMHFYNFYKELSFRFGLEEGANVFLLPKNEISNENNEMDILPKYFIQ